MSNFTNSPLINLTNLSPFRNSPRNQPIRKITVHHFAGNVTIEAVSNFLRQPGRNASYNYGIGTDGRIVLIVNERDRCWGSSSADNDNQAVVIGVANNTGAPTWGVSDRAFESLINLCRCICDRNRIEEITYTRTAAGNLTRHNMFAATLCPGQFLQTRFPEIARRLNGLIGQPQTGTPTTPQQPETFRVGDIVEFTGGGVFTSSRATTPAHLRGRSRCRVTQLANGAPQPLHLVSEDGGRVHGWVMVRDVSAFRVGDIVEFTGGGVFTSSRATTPAHLRGRSRCRVTQLANGAPQPLHLVSEDGGRVHGWVMTRDVTL